MTTGRMTKKSGSVPRAAPVPIPGACGRQRPPLTHQSFAASGLCDCRISPVQDWHRHFGEDPAWRRFFSPLIAGVVKGNARVVSQARPRRIGERPLDTNVDVWEHRISGGAFEEETWARSS